MLKLTVLFLFVAIGFLALHIDGFLFHHTAKCQISVFKGGKDFGGEKIMANKTFLPYLKSIGAVAKACKVKVHVLESYKQLKTPTEYVLTSQLPLALGHGIRFNLQNPKGATVCNNLCMTSRSWKTVPEAACFIDNVQKKGIKFQEPDLLHDGVAAKLSSTQAEAAKVATQKLCAPKVKAPKG